MFQLEILDARIYGKDRNREDAVMYVACRAVVGNLPRGSLLPVWVYGAGRPTVQATISYMSVHPGRGEDFDITHFAGPRATRGVYVLERRPGEEIAVGMMISDVPPDTLQGQLGNRGRSAFELANH